MKSAGIAAQWPFHGRGVQAGQYRTAPPAFLMARSVRRVPSQMRIKVKPIPACQMTAISRAPCPQACWSSRSSRSAGPADVMPGVPVRPVEVEHVDDAGLPGHGRVLQSTTQATGHAVPHVWQVRAISVMPSPVWTSDSVMSSDPQSGQTWAWNRTRSSFTVAHPCRGCRRGSAGRGGPCRGRGW